MGFDIISSIKTAFDSAKPATVNGPDFSAGFVITEVIKNRPMSIALIGNAMPHQPFSWGGELRTQETYYPGNPEPSIQVFGTKEEPLVIKGRFFDKRQPKNSKPVAPQIVNAIEVLRKRGNLLKLQLGDWTRYGYMTKAWFNMKKLTSIEYEITFLIVSESEPKQNPILGRRSLPAVSNAALIDLNRALQNNVAKYPSTFPKGPFDLINGYINDVAKVIAVATGAVDTVLGAVEQTSAGLNRAVGLVAVAKTAVFKTSQRIGKLSLDQQVREKTLASATNYKDVTRAYPNVKRQNVNAGYQSMAAVQGTQRTLMDIMSLLASLSREIKAFLQTSTSRRHLVKTGETLHTIAVLYYNNADKWIKIRDQNKLSGSEVPAGKVLEIPK